MNPAFFAIGCAFVAIGAASLGRAKKAEDETARKNAKLSGMLMMLAGAMFMVSGVIAKF